MAEHLSNGFATQLDGSIDDSQTTILVDSVTGAPAPSFRLLIEDEIVVVTGVSTLTLTVARGQEGTIATAHADNTPVTNELTAEGTIGVIRGNAGARIESGPITSRTVTGQNQGNRLYLPSDYPQLSFDDNTIWRPFSQSLPLIPINNADFSWVNQGGATITQYGDAWSLYAPPNTTQSLRTRVKTLTYTSNYTATIIFVPTQTTTQYSKLGICLRQSSTGKMVVFNLVGNNVFPIAIYIDNWDSATAYNAGIVGPISLFSQIGNPIKMVRIIDDGTNRKIQISLDFMNWVQIYSVSRTSFITPDQIGFFASPDWGNTTSAYLTMLSLTETTP